MPPNASTKCPVKEPKKSRISKRKKEEMEENAMLKSAFNYLESIKRTKGAFAEDSDHQFGMYIASELRSIEDEHIKKIIKHKMQCILYEMQLDTVAVRQANSSFPTQNVMPTPSASSIRSSFQASSSCDLNQIQPPYITCLSALSSTPSPKANDFSSVSNCNHT